MKSKIDARASASALLAKRTMQIQQGGARAAVLGVNDGLVSTLSIVLAVAGAGGGQTAVQLAGFAGLLAGAVSMAAGEWISVKSQVELLEGVLSDLKKLIKDDRALLTDQLAARFHKNGITQQTARAAANDLGGDDEHLHEVYATRVMGMNTEELGSPWAAAASSFMLFIVGSVVALLPWFVFSGTTAIVTSIISTGIGGLATGAYVAYSSGKSQVYGALRQLLIVIFAAAVTYGVGYVFGVSIT